MKSSVVFLASSLLIAGAAAHAGGGGVLYHDAISTPLASAYAFEVADAFDPAKKAVVVVLSNTPIDAAAFNAADDRKAAIDHYLLWKADGIATSVTLMIGKPRAQNSGGAERAGRPLQSPGMSRHFGI